MTDEELSTAVYNRMLAEQDAYKKRLLKMNPEEILNHAYEYSVREDILCAMEGTTLSGDQAYALLGIDSPLKGIYDAYQKIEFKYIDEIYQSLEDFASVIASEHASLRNLPVYPQSFEYAQAHDEIDQYRLSFKANVACSEAIERAITQNYAHNCMDCMASKQVVQNFGFDRTLYVLANTVQLKDWDARFSWLNKEWAKQFLIPGGNDGVRDHRWRFVVGKSHPGLTDMFLTMVRHDHEESCKQRASVRDQLKSHTAITPQKVKEKSRKEEVR